MKKEQKHRRHAPPTRISTANQVPDPQTPAKATYICLLQLRVATMAAVTLRQIQEREVIVKRGKYDDEGCYCAM